MEKTKYNIEIDIVQGDEILSIEPELGALIFHDEKLKIGTGIGWKTCECGGGEIALGYGSLYNWYAATDVRGIAPDGWRVPDSSDFTTLVTSAESSAAKLKSDRVSADGDPYWDGGAGTNDLMYSWQPAGKRNFDGSYTGLRTAAYLQCISTNDQAGILCINFSDLITRFATAELSINKKQGNSIRCVRDTEPTSDIVTDASGNEYTWVQIGSQYWLQQSLRTTKYNNGDDIPTGLDNTEWAETDSGAWAYPNGDSSLPI